MAPGGPTAWVPLAAYEVYSQTTVRQGPDRADCPVKSSKPVEQRILGPVFGRRPFKSRGGSLLRPNTNRSLTVTALIFAFWNTLL